MRRRKKTCELHEIDRYRWGDGLRTVPPDGRVEFADQIGNLNVVRMKGWRRAEYFDETGVKWVNPSPNLRSVEEAVLYPGAGMLDATNVSVMGTGMAFEVLGAGADAGQAAWFDGKNVAAYLTARKIPEVEFATTRFALAEDGSKYPRHDQTIEGCG